MQKSDSDPARPAVEERITVWTTIRLLYRPEAVANLISERIVNGKGVGIPKLNRKVRDVAVAIGMVTVIPFVLFLMLMPVGWLLSPVILAALAATLTLQELRSSIVDQVRLTALPDASIIRGLVGGVLARLKLWRIASTLWAPALMMIFTILGVVVAILMDDDIATSLYVFGVLIMILIGVIGGNILGAALGVMLALWWRNMTAVVASLVIMMAFITVGIVGVVLTSLVSVLPGLLVALIFLIAPYLLATGAMNLSRRWIGERV